MQQDEPVWEPEDDLRITGSEARKRRIASAGDQVEEALLRTDLPGDALEESRMGHAAEDEMAHPASPQEFRESQRRLHN